MVGGIGPGVPYSPAVALAALTATLVTLILAFNTWWNSEGKDDSENKEIECPSCNESNDSIQETPSPSIEEESTATSYLISTSLTDSDRPYNDYELDSIEDVIERGFINLKVESEIRLKHDDVDILEFSNLPQSNTVTQHFSDAVSSGEASEPCVSRHNSQLQKSKDLRFSDGGLGDDKCVENHSSRSGVSGEISTSHEYKWIERKTGHALLDDKYSDVVGSGESDVVQQCGTRFKDLGQTAPQFVQNESELSVNCGRENFQSKHEVFCTEKFATTENGSASSNTSNFSCRRHLVEGSSRESFNMKVADFEELDEVCDNNIIFRQLDSESISAAAQYSLDSHINNNNIIPSFVLTDKLTKSDSDDNLSIADSSNENNNKHDEELQSFISDDVYIISNPNDSIIRNMDKKVRLANHEKLYNSNVNETDMASKDNGNIIDHQALNEDCTGLIKSRSMPSKDGKNSMSELLNNDISSHSNHISNEHADPDILQHSSSQSEKSIPDILQSSLYSCETTSDTLFFLYDGTTESSRRTALGIHSNEYNLLPNNPIIALTEKLSLTEKILSKSTIKTGVEKIYQKANDVSENFSTNKFDAPEKNDLVLKSCQLTVEDQTPVTFGYKMSAVSKKENHEDTVKKTLDGLRESDLSIDEGRGKRNTRLGPGGDKIEREEKEEDEGEIKRGYMNSVGTNNGSVHSCLPSPSDVTSGAMHHGPLFREVQGSGREKLIGKACASQNYHNSIAASPAEGEKKNGFPPQMVAAKDLEIEMDARSCERHDPGSHPILLSSGRQPDKFDRLNALVDHLRELAGDSPLTEDESLGATSDHDADVSDNVTSTTENSSYVSAPSEFILSSSDNNNKRTDILNYPVLHQEDYALNAPSIIAYGKDANLEYSQQSFGLLSEYYTDVNNGLTTPESSVSDINIYNIIAPFLTDATDTSLSSDDFSFSETSKSLSKNKDSLGNCAIQKDINEIDNSLSKSDSETLALTNVLNPLRCNKTLQSSVENLSPEITLAKINRNRVRNPTYKLISKENINSEIMAESLSRDRLLKLLERNKKRQERLQHLSKLTNEPCGDNEHSQEQKNDAKHTMEALESAIGHIQQLISNDPASNFRKKELDLVYRTIAVPRSTEADSDIPILGKDHENMHAYHDQIQIPSFSSVDRTQVHHVYPFEMNRANETENVRSWVQSRNTGIDEKPNPDNNWQNVSKNTSVIKEWDVDPGNKNISIYDIEERPNLITKEGDRWRYSETKEIEECTKTFPYFSPQKHGTNRNYEPVNQFPENFGFQDEKINIAKSSNEKSSGYEISSFNVEREPKPKIKSMLTETKRGRCESHDVAVSQPLRLKATERTAVAEGQSFRNDIARKQFLQPLVMQEEQQNGEGSDGTEKNDSPSKQNSATNTTTTTPTKIKNLRFKLDPDIYDLPSENGYEEDESDYRYRRGWKRQQPKYHTFSSLELGRKNGNNREPVKVVSVRTSVVPGSQKIQKMVVKPVCVSEGQRSNPQPEDTTLTVKHLDIDLHIRLETSENGQKASESTNDVVRGDWRASPEKHLSKRQYANTSPLGQHIKKRSPIPEFSGWNQSLSPVTENCDWTPGANESAEDVALLSTSSDPGQRHRWTPPDSGHQSPASWDVEDASFRFKNDFSESETLDSFLAMDSGECNAQRTDESRHVTLSRSSDNFFLDNGSPKSDSAATISSSNSTPTRPSSLSLSHFRKHLNLPKKRFVPDPEAIERITGYKAAEQTSSSRPPLPPGLVRPLPSYRLGSGAKNRIDQLRKRYLDSAKSQMMAAQKIDGAAKFEQFLSQAQRDRANLVTSTPDLAAFEAAVRRQWSKTTMENKRKASRENDGDSSKENTPPPLPNEEDIQYRSRSNTPDHVWMSYVQLLRRQLNRRSQSLSYLETDVDAIFGIEDISQSMTTLERSPSPESTKSVASMPICNNTKSNRISISLEESGRTKSEHELRIEKSLQTLTLPDWYKHSSRPKTGFLLDKKPQEKRGWAAAKSLASSTSSLASSDPRNKRSARSLRASRENIPWSRGSASPASADNSFRGWSRSNSGPVLSLALAKAFREPYIGWRARTPSSGASSSPQVDLSPPSWVVMGDNTNTDRSETPLTSDFQGMDEEGDTGISFDGEDILEEDSTSDQIKEFVKHRDSLLMEIPSADDTCDDVINISMDTCDDQRVPHLINGHGNETNNSHNVAGEDTCEDIKNITLDTFEDQICEKVLSPQTGDDTCDDVLNISTDTSSRAIIPHLNGDADRNVSHHHDNRESTEKKIPEQDISPSSKPLTNGSAHHSGSESPVVPKSGDKYLISKSKFDPKRKRYSYNRSIYQSELDGLKRDNDQRTAVDIRCSTRSLPGKNRGDYEENEKDSNKVIWIESSFVGSRTTTSIVVLPTNANGDKDGHKGESTGSNSSVGRPASR